MTSIVTIVSDSSDHYRLEVLTQQTMRFTEDEMHYSFFKTTHCDYRDNDRPWITR